VLLVAVRSPTRRASTDASVSPPPKTEFEKWDFFTHNHDSILLDTIISFTTNSAQHDNDDDAMSDVSGCSGAMQDGTAPAGPVLPGVPTVHRYYPLVLFDMTFLLSETVVVADDDDDDGDDVPLEGF